VVAIGGHRRAGVIEAAIGGVVISDGRKVIE
jgi:hypothetical protein